MKAIILGDVHVGKGTSIGKPGIGNTLNSRVQDQFRLLDWVLQTAIDNDVFDIILTGDVFEDSKPHPTLISLFLEWLHKCDSHGVSIYIILGNHEIIKSGSYMQTALDVIARADIPNTHVFKYVDTIHFDDVSFTLLPFKDRRSMECSTHADAFSKISNLLDYESSSIPLGNYKVLIGHLALEGSIPIGDEIDDVAIELMCPLTLFKDYDYVWMGHIHKPQVCQTKPYLAHVGSMDISDYGETDHNKIIILFDTKNKDKFTEITIPTRPLRKLQISVPIGEDTTPYLISSISDENQKKSLKDAIVKLEIKLGSKESANADRDVINHLIYSFGAHYISNFSESKNVAVVTMPKQGLVDNSMDVNTAIKIWADNSEFDEEMKTFFLEESNEVLQILKDKQIGD